MNVFSKYAILTLCVSWIVLITIKCGDSTTENSSSELINDVHARAKNDSISTGLINIAGQVFAIPSPVQTFDLISKSDAKFNSSILNSTQNTSNYLSTYHKSLNMGVYGADLAYIMLYKQDNLGSEYLKTVRDIATDIGLESSFNEELAKKLEKSMNNQYEILSLISDTYTTADDYLKENKKDDVAALIVVGGWIESIYFAIVTAKETNNKIVIERVTDQKGVLKTILAMLKQYEDRKEYYDLALELKDLYSLFDDISYSYEFIQPFTDECNKLTTFKSKHNVTITAQQLHLISEKVKLIRNEIIGQ